MTNPRHMKAVKVDPVSIDVWQTVALKLAIMVLQRDSEDPPAMLEDQAYELLKSCVTKEMAARGN